LRLRRLAFRKARIEIVPMIDTIFFLLVFFMMSTLSMVKLKGLMMKVPRPAIRGEFRPKGEVMVSISDDGGVQINSKSVSVKDLPDRFAAAIQDKPTAAVVLKVSETQKTQALVSTMDLMNEIMAEHGNKNPILVATKKS
jgi:biopolymer transport protein ExbD